MDQHTFETAEWAALALQEISKSLSLSRELSMRLASMATQAQTTRHLLEAAIEASGGPTWRQRRRPASPGRDAPSPRGAQRRCLEGPNLASVAAAAGPAASGYRFPDNASTLWGRTVAAAAAPPLLDASAELLLPYQERSPSRGLCQQTGGRATAVPHLSQRPADDSGRGAEAVTGIHHADGGKCLTGAAASGLERARMSLVNRGPPPAPLVLDKIVGCERGGDRNAAAPAAHRGSAGNGHDVVCDVTPHVRHDLDAAMEVSVGGTAIADGCGSWPALPQQPVQSQPEAPGGEDEDIAKRLAPPGVPRLAGEGYPKVPFVGTPTLTLPATLTMASMRVAAPATSPAAPATATMATASVAATLPALETPLQAACRDLESGWGLCPNAGEMARLRQRPMPIGPGDLHSLQADGCSASLHGAGEAAASELSGAVAAEAAFLSSSNGAPPPPPAAAPMAPRTPRTASRRTRSAAAGTATATHIADSFAAVASPSSCSAVAVPAFVAASAAAWTASLRSMRVLPGTFGPNATCNGVSGGAADGNDGEGLCGLDVGAGNVEGDGGYSAVLPSCAWLLRLASCSAASIVAPPSLPPPAPPLYLPPLPLSHPCQLPTSLQLPSLELLSETPRSRSSSTTAVQGPDGAWDAGGSGGSFSGGSGGDTPDSLADPVPPAYQDFSLGPGG